MQYKELQRRKHEVQDRVRRQLEVLSGLEENILDFYYTHTIRYEPLLQELHTCSSSSASAVPMLSDNLISLFPELKVPAAGNSVAAVNSENATAAAASVLPVVPSKTRYYYDSALMRLYREAAVQERDLAQQYAAEEARVAATERQIQTDIIDGALAAQLGTERDARTALEKLEATLAHLRSTCDRHQTTIEDVESRIAATEKAVEACQRRKAVLEAKKQEQMDNAEKIKDEVAAFRHSVEAAARELEKRVQINKSLEDETVRRKALLRRKRKD